MKRLTEKTCLGLVIACRLATCPTSVAAAGIDRHDRRVVRLPSAVLEDGRLAGFHDGDDELVVPRSMPRTFASGSS